MTLSEQVHKVLAYIQDIEVPTNRTPWETGRAFYENFIPLAGEKENVFQIEEQMLNLQIIKTVLNLQFFPLQWFQILYRKERFHIFLIRQLW